MTLNAAQVAHGPFLIGVILNIVLYGVMISQTFMYFTNYKHDRRWMQLFVAFLFLADTVNSVFDLVYIYDCLVNHFGDAEYLTNATWVFATDPVMTGIIGSAVQLFYAWRVHVVSKNIFCVVAIVVCAAGNLLGSIGTSIGVGIVPKFTEFQKFEVIVIIWLACAAVGDVTISSVLVWHLSRHKTGFAATDDIINRVIRLTVQTGLVTAVCAVIDLVCYLTITTGIHLIFNVPLAKLYTNCLMSSLNCRGGWKFSMSPEYSVSQVNGPHRGPKAAQVKLMQPEIRVHVESHEMVDVDAEQYRIFGQCPSQKEWDNQKGIVADSIV